MIDASAFYDEQWTELGDFIRYNPGSRHRRRIVGRMLRGVEFDSVLDVGCGPGEMLVWMKTEFPETKTLWGVDIGLETVAGNRARMPWARFEQLDIERDRVVQDFALVVCSEVVEHLRDRPAALTHLASMVKPGGHLLVTCPTGRMFPTEMHFGHTTHPTVTELLTRGTDVGLDTVRYEHWGWPTYALTKRLTNLWPNWALQQFGKGKYSVAKKLVSHGMYLLNFANLSNVAAGCQLFWLYRKPLLSIGDVRPKAADPVIVEGRRS